MFLGELYIVIFAYLVSEIYSGFGFKQILCYYKFNEINDIKYKYTYFPSEWYPIEYFANPGRLSR